MIEIITLQILRYTFWEVHLLIQRHIILACWVLKRLGSSKYMPRGVQEQCRNAYIWPGRKWEGTLGY